MGKDIKVWHVLLVAYFISSTGCNAAADELSDEVMKTVNTALKNRTLAVWCQCSIGMSLQDYKDRIGLSRDSIFYNDSSLETSHMTYCANEMNRAAGVQSQTDSSYVNVATLNAVVDCSPEDLSFAQLKGNIVHKYADNIVSTTTLTSGDTELDSSTTEVVENTDEESQTEGGKLDSTTSVDTEVTSIDETTSGRISNEGEADSEIQDDFEITHLYWSIPLIGILLLGMAIGGFYIHRYAKKAGFTQASKMNGEKINTEVASP